MPIQNSQKGSTAVILLFIIIIGLIAGGAYWYLQQQNMLPATQTDSETVKGLDDSALKINPVQVADADNAHFDFINLKGLFSSSDSTTVSKYLAAITPTSTPTAQQMKDAQALLTRRAAALKILDDSAKKSKYYCDPRIGQQTGCNINDVRALGRLAVVQADIFYRNGKYKNAADEIMKAMALAQKTENSSDTYIPYLVAIEIKKFASNELLIIAKSGKLSSVDKTLYKQQLQQYIDDTTSLKNIKKYDYQRMVEAINVISTGEYTNPYSQNDKELLDTFIKGKKEAAWNPAATKAMFYKSLKTELDNVDLMCGAPYKEDLEKIDIIHLDKKDSNYLGKTLYGTTAVSFNNLNIKKCELIKLYQDLQTALSK
jgi:hypothetical protein